MTVIDTDYFKVDIQYIQKSQLLVVAKNAEAAIDMVKANVAEDTEGFEVLKAEVLSDEEKEWVLQNMAGVEDDLEPSGEIQDTRTLN